MPAGMTATGFPAFTALKFVGDAAAAGPLAPAFDAARSYALDYLGVMSAAVVPGGVWIG